MAATCVGRKMHIHQHKKYKTKVSKHNSLFRHFGFYVVTTLYNRIKNHYSCKKMWYFFNYSCKKVYLYCDYSIEISTSANIHIIGKFACSFCYFLQFNSPESFRLFHYSIVSILKIYGLFRRLIFLSLAHTP